ncbi:MAG: hypothetical protein P1P63_03825 [Treponemataceae bacterium]
MGNIDFCKLNFSGKKLIVRGVVADFKIDFIAFAGKIFFTESVELLFGGTDEFNRELISILHKVPILQKKLVTLPPHVF